MQDYFYHLADLLMQQLRGQEVCLCTFGAEQSDFVRFNQAKIRQAGRVEQYDLTLNLIQGKRHIDSTLSLSGHTESDEQQLIVWIDKLRSQLPHVPEDPHLLYAIEEDSIESIEENRLPDSKDIVNDIFDAGQRLDLVGFYAAGGLYRGFANSLGQRHWHSRHSFNFNWSLYHSQDRAVKSRYAGFEWNRDTFTAKMQQAKQQLDLLKKPARTIPPGQYRAFLAPAALCEIVELLSSDGFSLQSQRTRHSSLQLLVDDVKSLNPSVTLKENTQQGLGPRFQADGFTKPSAITLIDQGRHHDSLISPRSAKEYGVKTNGANNRESPTALELVTGTLPHSAVLKELDTGLYINNLWYLNYSDHSNGRMTGMTRFATFWVENGQITTPLNVMRFDETVYNILGDALLSLTQESDFIPSDSTYGQRSTDSTSVPGALVQAFTLTL